MITLHNHTTPNHVAILLVEDDDIDAESIKRAFIKHRINNPIYWVKTGLQALEALRTEEALQGDLLVLLDLNMPQMNGVEFLEALRDDLSLNKHIVFVLTSSDESRDKVAAYEKQVAGYLLKSRVGEDFLHMIELLNIYGRYIEFPPSR